MVARLGQDVRVVPKPKHNRIKKTAKQRGAISPSTRKKVQERSKGYCERCGKRAVHMCHSVRRWKLQETTENDLIHGCIECHIWFDTTKEGREWMLRFKERLVLR